MEAARRFSRCYGGVDVFAWSLLLSLVGAGATQAKPRITFDDVVVTEGNVDAVFTVTLSAPSVSTVTVDYATRDGSATAGDDYRPAMGTLVWPPGETLCEFAVGIIDDDQLEPDEMFIVDLSNPINATLDSPSVIELTIIDDEIFADGFESGDTGAWSRAVP